MQRQLRSLTSNNKLLTLLLLVLGAIGFSGHCAGDMAEPPCATADVACNPAALFFWGRPEAAVVFTNRQTTGIVESAYLIGTAEASTPVLGVEVALNDGEFQPAEGTTTWRYRLPTTAGYGEGTEHRVTVRVNSIYAAPSSSVETTITIGRNRDINGDGFAELLVAATTYDSGVSNAGRLYLYYGRSDGSRIESTSPAAADVIITGTATNESLGSGFNTGDLNGDGYADLFVGASGAAVPAPGSGAIYVYYGSANGISATSPADADATLRGTASTALGQLLYTGDVNGDGYADIVVGASGYLSDRGGWFVFHGSAAPLADGDISSADTTVQGEAGLEELADDLFVADVNADGYADVIANALGYPAGVFTGRSYVHYGSPGGLASGSAAIADVIFTGTSPGNEFGAHPRAADLNADGYTDLLFQGNASYRIFFGNAGGFTSTVDTANDTEVLAANTAGARVADLNADGLPELILLAQGFNSLQGRVYVFSGRSSWAASVPESESVIATGESSAHSFGSDLRLGDWNGNRHPELFLSAPRRDAGAGAQQGSLYLFYDADLASSLDLSPSLADGELLGEGTTHFFGDLH